VRSSNGAPTSTGCDAVRVLIADEFEQSGRDQLLALGCEVRFQPKAKDEALVLEVEQFQPDVLIVRSTKVPEAVLNAGALKLVVRAGAGYNNIDVAAASRRGIYVSTCPGKNSVAVAELAFGLILALDRQIADNVLALREGRWNKSGFSKARGLYGRTLGLIGLGQIARQMIPRASAFGLPVVAWSRSLTPETAKQLGVEYKASPAEVAATADIVSVHLALNAQTRGLIDAAFFNAMRPGAYFVNTSRAEVVDQEALTRAIQERGIRAGLDVFAKEPAGGSGPFADEIVKLNEVYGTHHIGASTEQAQEAIAEEAIHIIETYVKTGIVLNCVNLATRTPAKWQLLVRHYDRVGVLAFVMDKLRRAEINIEEVQNVIFEGAMAASCRIQLNADPDAELLAAIKEGNSDIIDLELLRLGD